MEIWLRDRKQPNMTRSLSYNGPIQNLGAAPLAPAKRGKDTAGRRELTCP